AGGRLRIVATEVEAALADLVNSNGGEVLLQSFSDSVLDNAVLVIAATDNPHTNQQVADAARSRSLPVNVVDQPRLCTFIMPALVDRSPVLVAISSSGRAPVLTRSIKELNESLVPQRIGELAELLSGYRERIKQRVPDFTDRVRFWEALMDSEIPELVYAGNRNEATKAIEQRLEMHQVQPASGEVYLVGAGPGDPDLLTLRALRLMHQADVVLYDRLVSAEVLARVRPDAEQIHVGKERDKHPVAQGTINQMLVDYAREGKKVLRLKGGDPFIFGRGGEELATLTEAGIPFQVVPGITAASGCAAYAGIPLTHRDHAQSVRFLTGHLQEGSPELDWDSLINPQETLVFYMALLGLETICQKLIDHGRSPDVPVAVIQQGTLKSQKVVTGTLADIHARVEQASLRAPTLTIVGEVVTLRDELSWFQPGS
ncbi:MAG: siroheme synthase CysG, partial [Gammaproteobacteria bacterium]